MTQPAVIVHLVGFPGVGKYTVARAISQEAERDGRRFVVVDNHFTANVIFSVMDVDGVRPIPHDVWDLVGDVRAALYQAIERFSPDEWSFVFTNVLREGEPVDREIVESVSALAATRGNPYVPVHLRCDLEENLRRVPGPDRRERMKWVDTDAVRGFVDGHELFRFDGHEPLAVDVTALQPDDAARRILDHISALVVTP